jgi:hypothetical protein
MSGYRRIKYDECINEGGSERGRGKGWEGERGRGRCRGERKVIERKARGVAVE